MPEFKTNFSMLAALYNLSGADISRHTGADQTLVSRWANGRRRLMPNHGWIEKVIDCFNDADQKRREPLIPLLISQLVPTETTREEDSREYLINWLCKSKQSDPHEISTRELLYQFLISPAIFEHTADKNGKNILLKRTYGIHEARMTLLSLADHLNSLREPTRITFICPEGIDIITRDPEYGLLLLGKMTEVFKRGFSLEVVMRTDFRMSDVSAMAGPWLIAHLLGYIKSRYYDDFRKIETDHMLIVADGCFAARIHGDDWCCEINNNIKYVQEIELVCQNYIDKSKIRFHYNLFANPSNYLANIHIPVDSASFLFQRLPHLFFSNQTFLREIGLSDDEVKRVTTEFQPLFPDLDQLQTDKVMYHLLCIDSLESALDQNKHICYPLSEMTGRRIMISTQHLVDTLIKIQTMLKSNKNYHVCFLGEEVFEKIVMEIGVWERGVAIGWIPNRQSTATKDPFNIATLYGFCDVVWNKIPAMIRKRIVATGTLKKLLNRAKRMGYRITEVPVQKQG